MEPIMPIKRNLFLARQSLQRICKRLENLNVNLVRKHHCSTQTHGASLNSLSFVKEECQLVRTRPADFNQSWSLLVAATSRCLIVFYFKQQPKLCHPPDLYLTKDLGNAID
ncbi:Hypothetical_protein [Hexamita inflata]|uniref:Hypothetical_protein n=1 Tax=Hexamita inflata TaxID=28002 RepID=A0AA86R3G9_9EUKA|nr:Hypothetical protein HINF_LOCUS53032 [Hexamita inflata]